MGWHLSLMPLLIFTCTIKYTETILPITINIKLLQNISIHHKITQQNTNSRGKYEIERIV